MNVGLVAIIAAVVAATTCRIAAALLLRRSPARLVRINVAGQPVPAVLGWAITIGLVAGYGVWGVAEFIEYRSQQWRCDPDEICQLIHVTYPWETFAGLLVLIAGMFAVGLWDDLKGDERPRGFAGHAAALRSGVWTGGLVKLIGGALTSLIAVFMFTRDVHYVVIVVAACVSLSANLLNLFDRAPGRALKVFVAGTVCLLIAEMTDVGLILAAPLGAAVAALPLDLKAKAMLGDAGANTLGALMGLGLILTTDSEGWLWALLALLLALNVASERWSFSEIIARNRVLARLDQLGRE